jgi:hypothetical protein
MDILKKLKQATIADGICNGWQIPRRKFAAVSLK